MTSPPYIADAVQETTSTVGLGDYVLLGASAPSRSFSGVFPDGATVFYTVTNRLYIETGYGALSVGTTISLSRVALLSSSTGNFINWPAGSKDIWCSLPVERMVYVSPDGTQLIGVPDGALPPTAVAPDYSGQVTVSTGFSLTLAHQRTLLAPATEIATGTIIMPATTVNGRSYRVSSRQQIDSLTITPDSGHTVADAPTFFPASQLLEITFDLPSATWYCTQG